MRSLAQYLLHKIGWHLGRYPFHTPYYLRHTARRLEHLASLELPIRGLRVLEVGAGAGDHSHYYLDRCCTVTITDVRRGNLAYLRRRYPGADVRRFDLENPAGLSGGPWDVVHCYGVLYHTGRPAEALALLASVCRSIFLLESRVDVSEKVRLRTLTEPRRVPSLAFHGLANRPTRAWLFDELGRHFEHIYVPRTQPNHEDFPNDWTVLDPASEEPRRAVFVASRKPIVNARLCPELPDRQDPHS
jgi:SAM-dependent methyltransferase